MTELIIIRGYPGSGKSTLAKTFVDYDHFEADMFFYDVSGKYVFNPSKIGEAHKWCQSSTRNSLSKGHSCVVSNTFTTLWEIKPYQDMVKEFGVTIKVIKCIGKWQNIHNVPSEAIQRMNSRWQDVEGEITYNPLLTSPNYL